MPKSAANPAPTLKTKSDQKPINPPDEKIIEHIERVLENALSLTEYLQQLTPPLSREVVMHPYHYDGFNNHNLLSLAINIKQKEAVLETTRLIEQTLLDEAITVIISNRINVFIFALYCTKSEGYEWLSDELIVLMNSMSIKKLNDQLIPKENTLPILWVALQKADDKTLCRLLELATKECINHNAQIPLPAGTENILELVIATRRSKSVVDALMTKLDKDLAHQLITKPTESPFMMAILNANNEQSNNMTLVYLADHLDHQIIFDSISKDIGKTIAFGFLFWHGPLAYKLMQSKSLQHQNSSTHSMLLMDLANMPLDSLRFIVSLNENAEEISQKDKLLSDNKALNYIKNRIGSGKTAKQDALFKVRNANKLNQNDLLSTLTLYSSLPDRIKINDGNHDVSSLIVDYVQTPPIFFMPEMVKHELQPAANVPRMIAAAEELHNKHLNINHLNKDQSTDRQFLLDLFKDLSKVSSGNNSSAMKMLFDDKFALDKPMKVDQNNPVQITLQYLSSNPYTLLNVNREINQREKEREQSKTKELSFARRLWMGITK